MGPRGYPFFVEPYFCLTVARRLKQYGKESIQSIKYFQFFFLVFLVMTEDFPKHQVDGIIEKALLFENSWHDSVT